MKSILAILLVAALAACATRMPEPLPDDPCASVPGDAVDGGIGGTGKGGAADCGDAVL